MVAQSLTQTPTGEVKFHKYDTGAVEPSTVLVKLLAAPINPLDRAWLSGFDVTLVVSVCLLIFDLFTLIKVLWTHAYDQFEEHFMSYVCINSDDNLYEQVIEWLQ